MLSIAFSNSFRDFLGLYDCFSLRRLSTLEADSGEGFGREIAHEDIKKEKRTVIIQAVPKSIDELILPFFASKGRGLERALTNLAYVSMPSATQTMLPQVAQNYAQLVNSAPFSTSFAFDVRSTQIQYARSEGEYLSHEMSYESSQYSNQNAAASFEPFGITQKYTEPNMKNVEEMHYRGIKRNEKLQILPKYDSTNQTIPIAAMHIESRNDVPTVKIHTAPNDALYVPRSKPIKTPTLDSRLRINKPIIDIPTFTATVLDTPKVPYAWQTRFINEPPINIPTFTATVLDTPKAPYGRQAMLKDIPTAKNPVAHYASKQSPSRLEVHAVFTPITTENMYRDAIEIQSNALLSTSILEERISFTPRLNIPSDIPPYTASKFIQQEKSPDIKKRRFRRELEYGTAFLKETKERIDSYAEDMRKRFGCNVAYQVVDLLTLAEAGKNANVMLPAASKSKSSIILAALLMAQRGEIDLSKTITQEEVERLYGNSVKPLNFEPIKGKMTHLDLLYGIAYGKNTNYFANIALKLFGKDRIQKNLRGESIDTIVFANDSPFRPNGGYDQNLATMEDLNLVMEKGTSALDSRHSKLYSDIHGKAAQEHRYLVMNDKQKAALEKTGFVFKNIEVKLGTTERDLGAVIRIKGSYLGNAFDYSIAANMSGTRLKLLQENYRKSTPEGTAAQQYFLPFVEGLVAGAMENVMAGQSYRKAA